MDALNEAFNPNMLGASIPQCEQKAIAAYGRPHQPNLTEKLEGQRAELSERLERIDAAIAALKSLPEFEAVLNAVSKAY